MSRAPPSVAAPPPEVDNKLSHLGINVDQRKRLMIAARLGIGPLGTNLPGPKGVSVQSQQPRARSQSPELPGPAGSSGYTAAQAAASEREKRRRELERKKDDEDEMDLQAFMGGCKKAASRAQQEKERQRIAAEQKARDQATQAQLRRQREMEAAIVAARAAKVPKISPALPMEEEVLAMLRQLKQVPPMPLSNEVCSCGTVFVQGAKFCSECGSKRVTAQAQEAPPDDQRPRNLEDALRKEEPRRFKEEKKRTRDEKAEKDNGVEIAKAPIREPDATSENATTMRAGTEKLMSEEAVLAMLRKPKKALAT